MIIMVLILCIKRHHWIFLIKKKQTSNSYSSEYQKVVNLVKDKNSVFTLFYSCAVS